MSSNSRDPTATTTTDQPAAAADGRVGIDSNMNMKKESSSKEQLDGGAAAKEGGAPRAPQRKRSSGGVNEHKKNRSSNEKNPQRRRCKNPRPRQPHIPEARVVQQPSNCAFVSEDDDGDQRDILETLREERLLQESIQRHTRLFTPSSHPHFFVTVHRSNSFRFSDDDGEEL